MKLLAAPLAALVLLAAPAAGRADWSAPQTVPSSPSSLTRIAVDARGDTAVPWADNAVQLATDHEHVRRYLTSVYVLVRTPGRGEVTRKLWSCGCARTDQLAVAVGGGEVTVAWVTDNPLHGAMTPILRVAYGPLFGRWSSPRVVGPDPWPQGYAPAGYSEFLDMAAAPDGRVLLTYNNTASGRSAAPVGMRVAWRRPRHPFGPSAALTTAPGGATVQFDARGTAYLSGVCDGTVLVAPSGTQRFTRRLMPTPGSVMSFRLSLSGAGEGLASWIDGRCSFDASAPSTYGPVLVSALRGGTFGAPTRISSASTQADYSNAVATAAASTVSWAIAPVGASLGAFTMSLGPGGVPGPLQQTATGPIPIAADGGGDRLLATASSTCLAANPWCASTLSVAPPDGGAAQTAPLGQASFPAFSSGTIAASAPLGRAIALIGYPDALIAPLARSLGLPRFSVWRP